MMKSLAFNCVWSFVLDKLLMKLPQLARQLVKGKIKIAL